MQSFMKLAGLSRGDESAGKKNPLETEIEKRGKAELTLRRDVTAGSEVKTHRDERGILQYREVDAVVTRNCEMDLVGGAYIIAPKEGRKYLDGGEAKVSVIDTPDARIVMVFRPSDVHFSQDGVGVSIIQDAEGGLRVGTALCDGKTKVKVSAALLSYLPVPGEDRVYYSRADAYAAFAASYFPRALALGLRQSPQTGLYEGGSAKVVAGALGEVDRQNSNRAAQTPYGLEREVGGMPWGTTTVQASSIRIFGGQMAVEVMNMGKADDLGDNALIQSSGAISKMGNTVGDKPLELGRYGTPPGFKADRLLAASRAGSRSGVAVVPEQIFVQVSDGFVVPRGGIRTTGSTVSLEQLLSRPSEEIVAILQTNASLCFGNEEAPHDDGTLIAVVPRSVLRRNGFDYAQAYGGVPAPAPKAVPQEKVVSIAVSPAPVVEGSAQQVETTTGPIVPLAPEIASLGAAADQLAAQLDHIVAQVAAADTAQIIEAVGESAGVSATAPGPQPEDISAPIVAAPSEVVPQEVEQLDPRLMLIEDVKAMLAKGLTGEQRVTLADVAKLMGVETPAERPVRQELVQAVTLLAQRLGVAVESQILTGETDEALVQIARHLEEKMMELKAKVELGWTKGTVDLDAVAALFELDIDPQAKQIAVDRANAKAASTAGRDSRKRVK